MSRDNAEIIDSYNNAKLGPIHLAPGITPLNCATLLYASFFSMLALTFLNFFQPFLLTEFFGIPEDEQGRLTGMLSFWQEILVIILSSWLGVMTDRWGRQRMMTIGMFIVVIGYGLYPFAPNEWVLIGFRLFFGLGAAAVGVAYATIMSDYPQNKSRGSLLATVTVLTSFSIMLIVGVLNQLPSVFMESGASSKQAGLYVIAIVMAIGVMNCFVFMFGLKPGVPSEVNPRAGFMDLLTDGLKASRKNPRLKLAYASAFVSRADLTLTGSFFSLWLVLAGRDQGLDTSGAMAAAGTLLFLKAMFSLFSNPFLGWIADRMGRVGGMAFGMSIAAAGHLWMGFQNDPLSSSAIPAAIMMGIGTNAAIITSGALIGQEAPARIRGSVIGVYSLFGAIGTLFTSFVGGQIFDRIDPAAPVIMIGIFMVLLSVASIYVRVGDGEKKV
ncbi:MAG: MFS transporter [Pseudomonadota bacterium]|nr:MFS transporter [Pseudomonadota bacterium]